MLAIGARLKEIRKMRGLTQKQVAEKAGMYLTMYQQYEQGLKNPREAQLQRLADALLVHVDFLRTPKADSIDAVLAYLYELLNQYGDAVIFKNEHGYAVQLPSSPDFKAKMNNHLAEVIDAQEKYDVEEFKEWLLNYRYHRIKKINYKTEKMESVYPELEVKSKNKHEGLETKP